MNIRIIRLLCLPMVFPALAQAAVKLPAIFSDHMVLQRDKPIPVWGWADPGEAVTVRLGNGAESKATADAAGRWQVALAALPAGGPMRMEVKAGNTLVIDDVLVGEVWICSGQSNMEWTVSASADAKAEIAAANHPRIRHIKYQHKPAGVPQQDHPATWQTCSPATAGGFTGVGYFFGRTLLTELDVPIGLINTSWGGTRIEPWTPPAGFDGVPALADIAAAVNTATPGTPANRAKLDGYVKSIEAWTATARAAIAAGRPVTPPDVFPDDLRDMASRPNPHGQPTTLYNGMVAPITGYGIRGAIWYQGESNHTEGMLYVDKKRALVEGWRKLWGVGDFPFYFVQIAPYEYGNEDPSVLPVFWEAQAACLEIPNTAMAVIHDVGNIKNIHPVDKQTVGKRLAAIALARDYGKKDLVHSGPVFKSLATDDAKLRLQFDHTGGGLATRDGKTPDWFEIRSAETGFIKADAVIDGNSVVLSAPGVTKPVAVRFAWHKLASPNLMNKEGWPAACFRAGDLKPADMLMTVAPDAAKFFLAYDLDLARLGPQPGYTTTPAPAMLAKPAKRVAYFLELQPSDGPLQYVWVAMDAFTKDIGKLALPTAASGVSFQQDVRNLEIKSNVPGLATGNVPAGNVEFWPNNYDKINVKKIPGANDNAYDCGDRMTDPVDGYGSMQVHNGAAGQTILAINNWAKGSPADIGIGNSPGETKDWTFTRSAGRYAHKRLRVLVQME